MDKPLVSICIPTYNGEKFLEEALDSIECQDYKNLEVVISDDESIDNTWEIIENYKESSRFPVFIYSHNPKGIGANWNNTLKYAKGKYIKFLFQDDVLLPTCISTLVSTMQTYPKLALVACKRTFITESPIKDDVKAWIENYSNLQQQFDSNDPILFLDRSLFGREDFLKSPLNKIGEPPTILFRKDILRKVGYFDESLKQILDYVFYYRVLKWYPIAIINQSLVKFRIHESQATNVNRGNDSGDYKKYRELLYKEFRRYLHTESKRKLESKFSWSSKMKNKLKRAYHKLRK